MADKPAESAKKSWFKELQTEFKKVIWPKRSDVIKETTAVVIVGVILGAIISVVDALAKYAINFILQR